MSDLTDRIRNAEPRVLASSQARESARSAAMSALASAADHRPGPRGRRLALALAGIAALAVAVVVAIAVIAARGVDQPARIVFPGDDSSPSAHPAPATPTRAGIAATIIFRPVAGVSQDDAYAQMVRVIQARAAAQRGDVTATVRRVDRDQALVTLTGTRQPITLSNIVAGSSVAAYDLDDVLAGTFSSFRKAVLRARQLAPGAPSSVAYLFRNRRLVRGPAPTEADLRRLTTTLPPGSQILGLPEGYAILRRQYRRDAHGAYTRLRSAQFFVVRDQPVVSPLDVVGADWPQADPTSQIASTSVSLTVNGRRAWDALLARVVARAAASGRPQRVAVTSNGDIEQITTADAAGRLDTRPGSPALEFGDGISGSDGSSRVVPTRTAVPIAGSIPALVWVADTYRVGPPPIVMGEVVDPPPARVRRSLQPRATEAVDLSTVRRALVADGPDGQWSVWNYALQSGSLEALVVGPRPDDGFGFSCSRTPKIQACGGMTGFQVFAVPAATRVLRFTSRAGVVRDAVAANGWAIALGPRVARSGPPVVMRAEALDASGKVLARQKGQFLLP